MVMMRLSQYFYVDCQVYKTILARSTLSGILHKSIFKYKNFFHVDSGQVSAKGSYIYYEGLNDNDLLGQLFNSL